MTPNYHKLVHRLRSSILKTTSFISRGYSSAPHGRLIPWTSTIAKSSERLMLQPQLQPTLKAPSQHPVPGKTKCWMLWTMMIRLSLVRLWKFLLHPPFPGLQKHDSPPRHLDPRNATPRSSLPPLTSMRPPACLCSPSDRPVH
jgi:hypothetical protein